MIIRLPISCIFFVALLATHNPVFAACDNNFNIDPSGVVSDRNSGLSWSRCLLGQVGADCQQSAALARSWVDALNQARGSELGGISNWRLPKIDELEAIFKSDRQCWAKVFVGNAKSIVWSASANLDYATDAWAFDFEKGERIVYARDSSLQILLVASPK